MKVRTDILLIYFISSCLAPRDSRLPKVAKATKMLNPVASAAIDGMTETNLKFTSCTRELPSRDFRISLRRVRIPGANEERSGTLVVARRKKKEAPRPRYVAGTQTGVLVSTSLTYTSMRERERVPVCTSREQVYYLPAPHLVPSLPLASFGPPSHPLRVSRVYRRHERYHVLKLKPRRKRDAWPPHLDLAPTSPPSLLRRFSFPLGHLRPKEKRKRRKREWGEAGGEMRGGDRRGDDVAVVA